MLELAEADPAARQGRRAEDDDRRFRRELARRRWRNRLLVSERRPRFSRNARPCPNTLTCLDRGLSPTWSLSRRRRDRRADRQWAQAETRACRRAETEKIERESCVGRRSAGEGTEKTSVDEGHTQTKAISNESRLHRIVVPTVLLCPQKRCGQFFRHPSDLRSYLAAIHKITDFSIVPYQSMKIDWSAPGVWVCEACRERHITRWFTSLQGLGAHRRISHGSLKVLSEDVSTVAFV